MIIRCPHCEFSRSIGEHAIPAGAEHVTCPKCKHRFRFRTVDRAMEFETPPLSPVVPAREERTARPADIWDAVDSLHQRWQKQMEEQVTDTAVIKPEERKTPAQQDAAPPLREAEDASGEEAPQKETPESDIAEKRAAPKKGAARKKSSRSAVSAFLDSLPLFASAKNRRQEKALHPKGIEAGEPHEASETAPSFANDAPASSAPPQSGDGARQDGYLTPDGPGHPAHDERRPHDLANARPLPAAPTEDVFPSPVEMHEGTNAPLADPEALSTDAPLSLDVQEPSREAVSAMPAPESEHSSCGAETATPEAAAEKSDDSGTFRPIFPYADDDTPPEERVARDMLRLQSTAERPVKDLGRIEDLMPDEEDDDVYGAVIGDIPWESPEEQGWGKGFINTVRGVMFGAPSFFMKVPSGGGLSLAFLFFLIQGYLAILCSVLWSYAAGVILDIPALYANKANLPFMLLLAPAALGLILVFSAGGMRLALDLFSPKRVPFSLVCKIVCYSMAPLVLSVIPFIGPLAGTIWFFVAMAVAGRQIFALPWFTAVFCTLPAALVLVAGMLLFFM